jgi:hypothetical protein
MNRLAVLSLLIVSSCCPAATAPAAIRPEAPLEVAAPKTVAGDVPVVVVALWKTLEQWQKRAALGNSPRTVLDELHRIQSTDVVLPTADHPLRELRIRCVVRPDQAQAALLDRLGLHLPERIRIPIAPAKM